MSRRSSSVNTKDANHFEMASSLGKMTFPRAADKKLLTGLANRSFENLMKEFERKQRELQRASRTRKEMIVSSQAILGLKKPAIAELSSKAKARYESALAQRPKAGALRPIARASTYGAGGINYPPYSFPWNGGISCGGLSTCSQYGPNASSGQIGADLGGTVATSASSWDGIALWYYSQANAPMVISTQAAVYGQGYANADIYGYVYAYGDLELLVYDGSGNQVAGTVNVIYDQSGSFIYNNTYFNGNMYTANVSVQLAANQWYIVYVGSYDYVDLAAAAGAQVNLDIFVQQIAICDSCPG